MRRKIHRVLRIIERVNVQIHFDPVALFALAHVHNRNRFGSLLANAPISFSAVRLEFRLKAVIAAVARAGARTRARSQSGKSACEPLSSIYHSRISFSRSGGGTGRHVRLRGVCRKACGFESRPEHDLDFKGGSASSKTMTEQSSKTRIIPLTQTWLAQRVEDNAFHQQLDLFASLLFR